MEVVDFSDLPRRDVTALSHKGSKGEPQAVEYAKLISRLIGLDLPVLILLSVPLVGAEAADEEQHHADTNVSKNYTHPNLIGQWIQEGEHPRLGLLGLLNHNGDAQAHEGFREVYHFFSNQRYS